MNRNTRKSNQQSKAEKERILRITRKGGRRQKYGGRAPVNQEKLIKHDRGEGIDFKQKSTKIKNKVLRTKLEQKEKTIRRVIEATARAEVLLTEDRGHLEADTGEVTTQYKQAEIIDNVDISSAAKQFNLNLEFGQYCMKYTQNGRHLLLGGRKGHVAAFDWVGKKLSCEMNVMESIHDVSWLHIETMFAVAQKDWVYIYDNQGIELHCLKRLNDVNCLEFLPYHFLLGSGSRNGYLAWLDVSVGRVVSSLNSKLGRINVMTQNPSNAVLCVGASNGTVSFWAPNTPTPLAKMLCHKQAINACAVHPHGTYMATSCPNRTVKVWDIRELSGPVYDCVLRSPANHLAYSATGLLAMGTGNVVELFRPSGSDIKPYLRYKADWPVSGMEFCPYEDVLGIATTKGFSSILVPGSGESNFDALEANPFQSKSQRREAEVKALLDKVQPEFITLDPTQVVEIDVPTLEEKVEAKKQLMFLKPQAIDFKPRRTKAKGKGGTAKIVKTKNILKELKKKETIDALREAKLLIGTKKEEAPSKDYGVLNRFVPKSKRAATSQSK